MRHHGTLRSLRHLGVPDREAAIAMAADELLALVMPACRLERLCIKRQQLAIFGSKNFPISTAQTSLRCNHVILNAIKGAVYHDRVTRTLLS